MQCGGDRVGGDMNDGGGTSMEGEGGMWVRWRRGEENVEAF